MTDNILSALYICAMRYILRIIALIVPKENGTRIDDYPVLITNDKVNRVT